VTRKKKVKKSVRMAIDLDPKIVEMLDQLKVQFGSSRKKQAERLLHMKVEQVSAMLDKKVLGADYLCMTKADFQAAVADVVERTVKKMIEKERAE